MIRNEYEHSFTESLFICINVYVHSESTGYKTKGIKAINQEAGIKESRIRMMKEALRSID